MTKDRKLTVPTTEAIRVWTGDRHIAATIPVCDLQVIQRRFRNKLVIKPSNSAGIMVYPDGPGDYTDFDAFMAQHTPLTPQMMSVDNL